MPPFAPGPPGPRSRLARPCHPLAGRRRPPPAVLASAKDPQAALNHSSRRLRYLLGTSEKYRMNDPAKAARAYADLIDDSIAAGPKLWLQSLSALEYYGFQMEACLRIPTSHANRPALDLQALLESVCQSLLDMDLGLAPASDRPIEEECFRQLDQSLSRESLHQVRRMVLGVTRIAIRYAVLRDRLLDLPHAPLPEADMDIHLVHRTSPLVAQLAPDQDSLTATLASDFDPGLSGDQVDDATTIRILGPSISQWIARQTSSVS